MLCKNYIATREQKSKQHVIAGMTLEMGVPTSKTVRIHDGRTGVLLGTVSSNTEGIYKIYVPKINTYTVIGIDQQKVFNAVVQDNVVPK